jgi:hypothetical protein
MEQEDIVRLAQEAAQKDSKPHQVLRIIAEKIKPEWENHIPYIQIEACLRRAFRIPLREARDIEDWRGLSKNGTLRGCPISQTRSSPIHTGLAPKPKRVFLMFRNKCSVARLFA